MVEKNCLDKTALSQSLRETEITTVLVLNLNFFTDCVVLLVQNQNYRLRRFVGSESELQWNNLALVCSKGKVVPLYFLF